MAESTVWHVGIDLHKESVSLAALRGADLEPAHEETVANDWGKIRRFFRRLEEGGKVRACYEAGACGYGLQRRLAGMGVECSVIAPSHTPVMPGDRRKTDERDARKLARFLRSGDLVKVHVPSEPEERVRDLVRSRVVLVREVHRSRQYVLKLVLRLGHRFEGGRNWTQAHRAWLDGLRLEGEQKVVLERYMALLRAKEQMRGEIDRDIEHAAEGPTYAPVVSRLRCLHGIDTIRAMVLAAEVVDAGRFAGPRDFMGWVGLTTSEHSSGGPGHQRMGGITKAGNARCRYVLIEAAWAYCHAPRTSRALQVRQAGQPADLVGYANRAQRRLWKRFEALAKRKERVVAVTAVARELAGFVWALMRSDADLLRPRRSA